MEPFATSHIEYQNGRFDAPERQFLSVAGTFSTLVTDIREYWELTPEFFFNPEFLVNSNHYDLGKGANDVVLPPWAKSPMEFVYLHRKALESDFVSDHLHHWIDLIWGVNQRNPDAYNVYAWHLYKRVWKDNPTSVEQIETCLRMVGQIPPKLFRQPHPPRRRSARAPAGPTCVPFADTIAALYVDDHGTTVYLFTESHGLFSLSLDNRTMEVSHVSKRLSVTAAGPVSAFPYSLIAQLSPDTWLHLHNQSDVRITFDRSVVSFASSSEYFSFSASDFTTAVYSVHRQDHPFWSFRSYHGPIVCSTISHTFKLHVSGTADGTLDLTSLATGESVCVISLGAVSPIALFVTPSWGFVVAYASELLDGRVRYSLIVHNVNGVFVRKAFLEDAIASPVVFRSARAFDYVAFFLTRRLCVCEAFALEVAPVPGGYVGANITGLAWSPDASAFVVADDAGFLRVVPYAPDDFAGLRG
jgi:hypothetical protein